jgi:hypothetical protein
MPTSWPRRRSSWTRPQQVNWPLRLNHSHGPLPRLLEAGLGGAGCGRDRRAGVSAASCSAGGTCPMALCSRRCCASRCRPASPARGRPGRARVVGMDQLGLVQPDRGRGQGVVERVTLAPDRGDRAGLGQPLGVADGQVLLRLRGSSQRCRVGRGVGDREGLCGPSGCTGVQAAHVQLPARPASTVFPSRPGRCTHTF